jgi:polysaccharide export outer membrane protein
MRAMRYILLMIVASALFSSCTINNSMLIKAPRDYVFNSIPDTFKTEYQLSPNDAVRFRLFANDGFQLIEFSTSSGSSSGNSNLFSAVGNLNYLIDNTGFAKMPILGRVQLAGMTVKEAEEFLQTKYSTYYNDPFVMLNIANRRVVVFPGNAGTAVVITLTGNNTTLLEALALAGGIADRGKASSIRLVRLIDNERHVFNVDLSIIANLDKIDIIVEANDVIYVEPTPDVAREILKDVAPIVSLISSAFFIWIALTRGV